MLTLVGFCVSWCSGFLTFQTMMMFKLRNCPSLRLLQTRGDQCNCVSSFGGPHSAATWERAHGMEHRYSTVLIPNPCGLLVVVCYHARQRTLVPPPACRYRCVCALEAAAGALLQTSPGAAQATESMGELRVCGSTLDLCTPCS